MIERGKPQLRVVHTLGGCGGTLLTRILGVLPGVVVLSECNPASALLFERKLNPYTQVREWHPEMFARVSDTFDAEQMAIPERFEAFVRRVHEDVHGRGGYLVIRDYNYVDYCGVPFVASPSMRSSLLEAVSDTFDVMAAAVVRHPLRQYRSLRSHEVLRDCLTPEIFLRGSVAFLAMMQSTPTVRYEDFVTSPAMGLHALCEALALPFDAAAIANYHANNAVTGNLRRADDPIAQKTGSGLDDGPGVQLERIPAYANLLERLAYDDPLVVAVRLRREIEALRAEVEIYRAAAVERADVIAKLDEALGLAREESAANLTLAQERLEVIIALRKQITERRG